MRELFAADNFDLKGFLTVNKEIPIDELLRNLEFASKTVQNELFELINGDLVHFQKVIEEVCKVDIDSIKEFRAQLESEKAAKENDYLRFKEYFEEADRKYQRLKYIKIKKEMMVRSEKARQYIEAFNERQSIAEHSIYELEICVKRYNWLLKFTTDYSTELLESDISRELSQYSERLQEILEIHMGRILKAEVDIKDFGLLLVLCQEMHKMNLFEASFKLSIVYPTLELFLQSSISFKGGLLNFNLFTDQVMEFVLKLKHSWADVINKFYAENDYKFWIRTVLSPILAWIVERCSSVFDPTNLDEFKVHFEKGLDFVAQIEKEFFAYEDELIFFRSQSSWINFMKRWSLHKYFQTRTRQIIIPIENIFTYELDCTKKELFEPTLVTLNAVKRLWSDEIILKPLIPKFLKITIQVFRRFVKYCEESQETDPKKFLLISLQKQFNLKQFSELFEENLKPRFEKYLDPFEVEEGLSEKLIKNLKEEAELSIKRSRDNLIPGIEKLYDQILKTEGGLSRLNLETLKILKLEAIEFNCEQMVQQILLKFNRIIFKMIDENRASKEFFEGILKKMSELEGEADELGYSALKEEEFWLEIKAAITLK